MRRRTDAAASLRRILARTDRRHLSAVSASPFIFSGVTALLAGLLAPSVFFLLSGVAVAVAVWRFVSETSFDEPNAAVDRVELSSSGMSIGQYRRRLRIHSEREELKEDKIEQERRRQKRQSNAAGGNTF